MDSMLDKRTVEWDYQLRPWWHCSNV